MMNLHDSLPSLTRIACIKVTIALWDKVKPDIELKKELLVCKPALVEWEKIEDKVIEGVQNLPLPELLKREVSNIVKPIGLQIYNWICLNFEHCELIAFPTELCWTSQGTVDKVRTAEALVEDVRLSVSERFVLACTYCLTDYISVLREQLNSVRGDVSAHEVLLEHNLPMFWMDHLNYQLANDGQANETDFYSRLFDVSAVNKKEMFKYLFQKLPHECRKKTAVQLAQRVVPLPRPFPGSFYFVDDYFQTTLCFFFSSMDEEQQTQYFKEHAFEMLACLLYWPYQSFLMGTEHMWIFLSPEQFYDLLQGIVCQKIEVGYKDYDYESFFSEFWKRSPHKRHVFQQCLYHCKLLFGRLVLTGNTDPISIFGADVQELPTEEIYMHFVRNGEWDLLEFFIRIFISSRSVLPQFMMKTLYQSKDAQNVGEDMWARLAGFIHQLAKDERRPDDVQLAKDKRRPDDGPSPKKPCT